MGEFNFNPIPWVGSPRGDRPITRRGFSWARKTIFWLALASSCCITVSTSFGDSASYYYDDLGRLTRVVKGTSGTIYSYDELGNLLSVSSGTTLAAPPIIDTINPDVLFIGSKLFVKIEGQNFLTTTDATSENPDLTIENVLATDSVITAEISVASSALVGSAAIIVTNPYGSDEISVTLSDSVLRLSPGQLAIVDGGSGNLTARIDPPLSNPLTIILKSSNPSIVNVPATVTIPNSGTEVINVFGNQEGAATITTGNPRSVVFVSAPFSGGVSGLTGGRVSVYIEDSADEPATGNANPISVVLDASDSLPTTGAAASVSVVVDASVSAPATGTAAPVSVVIDAPDNDPSATTSIPVSVEIQ